MTNPSKLRTFARHYAEMVAAMFVGMAVLGIPLDAVAPDGNTMMLVTMGISMTVPMVAWMRFRGHGWRASNEMAASMVVPTAAAIAVYEAGVGPAFGTIMAAEHVVMLVAMAAVMLLRPSEYLHHHHHAVAVAAA